MKKTKDNDMMGSIRQMIVENEKNLPDTEPNSDPDSKTNLDQSV